MINNYTVWAIHVRTLGDAYISLAGEGASDLREENFGGEKKKKNKTKQNNKTKNTKKEVSKNQKQTKQQQNCNC